MTFSMALTMTKLDIHKKKNSRQNVVIQIRMKTCKFQTKNVNVRIFEVEQQIQKGLTIGYIGSAFE